MTKLGEYWVLIRNDKASFKTRIVARDWDHLAKTIEMFYPNQSGWEILAEEPATIEDCEP
jgi:hypothetical protein